MRSAGLVLKNELDGLRPADESYIRFGVLNPDKAL
jgi:hypothetical protein